MTTFERVNIAAAIGAGLCGLAMALSPAALAGGYECVQTSTGEAPTGAPPGAVCAPLTDMAGVPMAFPGPPPVAPPPVVPPPLVPPIVPPPLVPPAVPPPLVPPPVVPPIAAGAPVAAGAPLTTMGGAAGKGGKGDSVGSPRPGAPAPGQPTPPGPAG
ncbi:hypothetical protein [Mycobacterium sp. IS-3022]|uniref:hypothetical protein n=1 Tax=Mycobacterium sp. IS-3022 TaxID=1772277 RepID=UPI0007417B16|nr:hypothetical protein [Mycobacterium sp. IS-3022]KUH99401.1 hypothetical protein AU188_11485 [Mycobacterium sp. IS-3022]